MALLSPPLFLLPDKHQHHHLHSLSSSSTPSFPLSLHSALHSQSFRSTRLSSRSATSEVEDPRSSFHESPQKHLRSYSSRHPPRVNYQPVSSSSSSSSPPWQKSTQEENLDKHPRRGKTSNGDGSSSVSFRPAPWQTQGSKDDGKPHDSIRKGVRYSEERGKGRDRDRDRDRGIDRDEDRYVDGDGGTDRGVSDWKGESKTRQRGPPNEGSRTRQRDRGVLASNKGWGTGRRDGDFPARKEGSGSGRRDGSVRKEGMSGTRQRDVLGWNGRSGTSQREELATKVVERLQPSLMVDATVSSHHENGAILSQSANVVSSEAGSLIPRRIRNPTRADLLIPPLELKRLRMESIALEERLKIGKLGVTTNIVISIHQQWNTSELVKVRCQGPAANNIKNTLTDLEQKTGGLVVWRDKNAIVIYRGNDYNVENGRATVMDKGMEEDGLGTINGNHVSNFEEEKETETEMERLLEGLGPRYEKWTGLRPIPIDADLLPPEVPNYKPPFRLLPFGERPRLSDEELTNLRRLARPLGPHFILGRNKGQQGLAVAMLKLWEKTEIVKIAVKKRVQNTNNEMMADQIWRLTGGVLLSRDKFFITFYRGKDFVPQKVATTLTERELISRDLQEKEENARDERNIPVKRPPSIQSSLDVIRSEVPDVKPTWVHTMDIQEQKRLKREVAKLHQLTLARQLEKRLDRVLKKKEKTEQGLQKIEAFMTPIEAPADVETITEEERFMYRRLGMKMKSTLLLGRRGIFDGVVENMHFHWKHRELVKLVVNEPDPVQLQESARMLEYESGGILVAIIPSSKGQEIIMYRGKNYQRPNELRPRNLLNKQKAFKRSIEMQRRASLIQNTQALEAEILKIKADLGKLEVETGESFDNKHTSGPESDSEPSTIEDESKEEVDHKMFRDRIKKLERLVALGAIHRADPLKNTERLRLRKKALSLNKASQFFVGKSNDLEGLARGIRIYFLHHALVKVVVKGRGQGTSIQDLVQTLENLTGGVLVSQESNKIIMYRGWPEGDEMPASLDSISPELRAALEAEEDLDDDLVEIEDRRVFNKGRGSDEEESESEEYISEVDGSEEEDFSDLDLQLILDDSDEDADDDNDDASDEEEDEHANEKEKSRWGLQWKSDGSYDEDDEDEDQVELHFEAQTTISNDNGNGNDRKSKEVW